MVYRMTALCFFSALVVGCASNKGNEGVKSLQEYVEKNGFTAFTPPRDADGIGTVISFDKKNQETIVSSRQKCLPASDVPSLDPKKQSVALLSGEYEISNNNELELGISRVLSKNILGSPLDLSGAIGRNGIRKIEVQFIEPFRDRIERIDAKDYIRKLADDDSCLEEFKRDTNYLIHTVLGAKGMKYSFIGESGKKIAITADIADVVKLDESYASKLDGKLGFEIEGNILIGYRIWDVKGVPGAFGGDFLFRSIPRDEVKELKKILK